MDNETDMVNKPPHYISKTGLEAIEVVEAFDLNRNLAAATEYILRADRKGQPIQDLEKAVWRLNREIKNRGGQPTMVEYTLPFKEDLVKGSDYDLLTTKEAAKILGTTASALGSQRNRGNGPPYVQTKKFMPVSYERGVIYDWRDREIEEAIQQDQSSGLKVSSADDDAELLTTHEASVLTGLSINRLANVRYLNKGPKYIQKGHGKKINYIKDELVRWMAEQSNGEKK
ncbi:DUF3310 domain-containing protein [Desulfosarcina sp.]|nr:DUF3310 domain-containing protein [Desulfosarcina sp.]